MNVYDALIEDGRTRLRPIWMTALAAILPLVPLAIGGLLTSTLFTLVIVPVAYSLSKEVAQRLMRRWKR